MEFWFSGDESWDILDMLTVVVRSCFERELGTYLLFLPVDVHPHTCCDCKGDSVVTIISVPCVLNPRLTIGTTSSTSAAHSSNLQLIRVELPTRDSTKKIDKSCNEKLVNRASTIWFRSRRCAEESGRR